MTPYGDRWRLLRRILAQEYNKEGSAKTTYVQERHAQSMLYHLLKDPESYIECARSFSSGVIMETSYGLQVQPRNDPYVALVETAVAGLTEALVPGAFLVDIFPLMRHIPSWFPGASFMRKANKWEKELEDSCKTPYDVTCDEYGTKNEKPSLVNDWLQRASADPDNEEIKEAIDAVRHATGAAMLAGYETTSSAILNFVYLMLANPKSQRKAQEELDRVIGHHRLPQYSDRDNLPYVTAVVKEVLRWFPNAPMGIPHCALEEDVYKGMRIPKGSLLLTNIWGMVRDKEVYGPDPEVFRPERHLDPNTRDPSQIVFGFGRRICPGRYLAEKSLMIVCASILHVFTIGKAFNEDGSEASFVPRWKPGIAVHIEPFPCTIIPRFPEAEALIDAYFQDRTT